MHLVDRAGSPPYHCALFPQLAGHRQYVDMGHGLPGIDPHVIVSLDGLREVIKFLGWPTHDDHERVTMERDELAERVAQLEADLTEERRITNAIDVLESRDFRARKKAGRPKKDEVPA